MATFHQYSQEEALSQLPPILLTQLPHSNPIYNRIRAPHNTPSRHCLFASTLPPNSPPTDGEPYTIIFADRSRHTESQIWVFNSLITKPSLSEQEELLLSNHVLAAIQFIKNVQIPEAPGWPFSSTLRFGCVHEFIAKSMVKICKDNDDAMPYITTWNAWPIQTTNISSKTLPEGLKVSRVPESQIDLVVATSPIPRAVATLLLQPSVGVLDEKGDLVAWGYCGVDGSFATLHVQPEHRGKGLGTFVANEILGRLSRGDYADLGFDGSSGWVHSDVKDGNKASESVMKSLGGRIGWKSSYLWIDSSKFS